MCTKTHLSGREQRVEGNTIEQASIAKKEKKEQKGQGRNQQSQGEEESKVREPIRAQKEEPRERASQ